MNLAFKVYYSALNLGTHIILGLARRHAVVRPRSDSDPILTHVLGGQDSNLQLRALPAPTGCESIQFLHHPIFNVYSKDNDNIAILFLLDVLY